ncbi:30S ribosomal protein S20 [Chloroflexota bacterium]
MANLRSQIKRNKQNEKRRLRNRHVRGITRAALSGAREAIQKGNIENSEAAVYAALGVLDKAAQKGILHKNNAARRKSRLMKRLADLKAAKE